VATFALAVGLWVVGPTLAGLMGVMGGKNDLFAMYMWTHPAVQTEMIVGATAGSQNARMPWRSLDYHAVAVSHWGAKVLGFGAVTWVLAGIAALYILAGFLFFWRAKRCLRRRIFG
jgi:hypothetical protein